MNPELLLELTAPSLLVIEERPRKDIVIGVPHHAPAGQATLPCPEHSDSDENAGFLGHYLAESLGCASIIACNYTIDGNKYLRSDYTMQIARWNPKVLVEIHGHGGRRARSDIEISSGSMDGDSHSQALADQLASILAGDEAFKDITICGEYEKIYFKASKSLTISNGRWLAYHLELPYVLRKTGKKGEKPPELGYRFCDLLAKVLVDIHGS